MWQAILLTSLGAALAMVGTIIGHRWQAAESRRMRREGYEREDRYRLFRERVEAYRAFHLAASATRPILIDYSEAILAPQQHGPDKLDAALDEARQDAFRAFIFVRLIGNSTVVRAASKIMREIDHVYREGQPFDSLRWSERILDYISSARFDLIKRE
jgi:hypothetical protein